MAEAPKATALITPERIQKDVEHTKKSEKPNLSGMPEHRNMERVYHEVEFTDKEKLTQKILNEAKTKMGPTFKAEIGDIPELNREVLAGWAKKSTKMSEIPPTNEPQIFKEKVKGTKNEYRLYVRLNNGEPNSVVVINSQPNESGKISLDLAKTKGFFHLTTEAQMDEIRTGMPLLTKGARTLEGQWLRGKITSEDYAAQVKKARGKSAEEFWKENDKFRTERTMVLWGSQRIDRREKSEYAVNAWASENARRGIDNIWEAEDKAYEEKKRRVEESTRKAEERKAYIVQFTKNIGPNAQRLGVSILESIGIEKIDEAEEEEKRKAAAAAKTPAATPTPAARPTTGHPKRRRKKK